MITKSPRSMRASAEPCVGAWRSGRCAPPMVRAAMTPRSRWGSAIGRRLPRAMVRAASRCANRLAVMPSVVSIPPNSSTPVLDAISSTVSASRRIGEYPCPASIVRATPAASVSTADSGLSRGAFAPLAIAADRAHDLAVPREQGRRVRRRRGRGRAPSRVRRAGRRAHVATRRGHSGCKSVTISPARFARPRR